VLDNSVLCLLVEIMSGLVADCVSNELQSFWTTLYTKPHH